MLQKLNKKQLIKITEIKNKTIYYIDLENITNYINKNINSTANKILNITEYAYIVTALFYGVSDNNQDSQIQIIYLIVFCLLFQLPTIVFSRTQKINKSCDKTHICYVTHV